MLPKDFVTALRIYYSTRYDFDEARNALTSKMVSMQNERTVTHELARMAASSSSTRLLHPRY